MLAASARSMHSLQTEPAMLNEYCYCIGQERYTVNWACTMCLNPQGIREALSPQRLTLVYNERPASGSYFWVLGEQRDRHSNGMNGGFHSPWHHGMLAS